MKKVLALEGTRSGYAVSQIIKDTITVGDFKRFIEDNAISDDTILILENDNGYTYGHINEYTLTHYAYDDEEDTLLDESDFWDKYEKDINDIE